MSQDGQGGGGDEGAGNPDPDHRAGGAAEPLPADMHPAVEQDDGQRDRDDPLDGGDRQLTQRRQDIRGHRRRDQEDRRRRDPDPLADPVEQDRCDDRRADDQHQEREVFDIAHRRAPVFGGLATPAFWIRVLGVRRSSAAVA